MLIEWKHFESILLKQKSYKNKLHKQKVILSRALTITTPPKNSLQLWLQSKTSLSVLFSCEGWTTPHFLIISAACTVTKVIVTDVTDLKLWVYLSHWRWTLRIWKTCKSFSFIISSHRDGARGCDQHVTRLTSWAWRCLFWFLSWGPVPRLSTEKIIHDCYCLRTFPHPPQPPLPGLTLLKAPAGWHGREGHEKVNNVTAISWAILTLSLKMDHILQLNLL